MRVFACAWGRERAAHHAVPRPGRNLLFEPGLLHDDLHRHHLRFAGDPVVEPHPGTAGGFLDASRAYVARELCHSFRPGRVALCAGRLSAPPGLSQPRTLSPPDTSVPPGCTERHNRAHHRSATVRRCSPSLATIPNRHPQRRWRRRRRRGLARGRREARSERPRGRARRCVDRSG